MELVGARRGQLVEMTGHDNYTYVVFSIPARGLIGLRTRLLNATQGTAVIHHRFERFAPLEGDIPDRPNGVLVSMVSGRVVRLRPRHAAGAEPSCSSRPATKCTKA